MFSDLSFIEKAFHSFVPITGNRLSRSFRCVLIVSRKVIPFVLELTC